MVAEEEGESPDVGSIDICQEVNWEVGVVKMLRRGKAPGPDGALNENVNVMVDVGW